MVKALNWFSVRRLVPRKIWQSDKWLETHQPTSVGRRSERRMWLQNEMGAMWGIVSRF